MKWNGKGERVLELTKKKKKAYLVNMKWFKIESECIEKDERIEQTDMWE